MKGGGPDRKLRFCVGAKLCSGKAKNEQEAIQLCSVPKEPKAGKVGKKKAGVNPCVRDVTARIKSGELPADTDIADVCAEVIDEVEETGVRVKIGRKKLVLPDEEFARICPCGVEGE
jgi:hypothetical protein